MGYMFRGPLQYHITNYEKVQMGKNVRVGYGAIIGSLSMVTDVVNGRRVWRDGYSEEENAGIIIGDNVTIGNSAYINFGWKEPTIIEDNVWIGNYSSVGHDCIMKENSAMVSNVILGGHSVIGEWSFLCPGVYVTPYVVIGKLCYIGPHSNVTKNVPDNSFGYGNPYRVTRENTWKPE